MAIQRGQNLLGQEVSIKSLILHLFMSVIQQANKGEDSGKAQSVRVRSPQVNG